MLYLIYLPCGKKEELRLLKTIRNYFNKLLCFTKIYELRSIDPLLQI